MALIWESLGALWALFCRICLHALFLGVRWRQLAFVLGQFSVLCAGFAAEAGPIELKFRYPARNWHSILARPATSAEVRRIYVATGELRPRGSGLEVGVQRFRGACAGKKTPRFVPEFVPEFVQACADLWDEAVVFGQKRLQRPPKIMKNLYLGGSGGPRAPGGNFRANRVACLLLFESLFGSKLDAQDRPGLFFVSFLNWC